MNEEEIIEQLKEAISEWYLAQEDGNYSVEFEEYDVKAIEELLKLYQQEKEKNKKLEEQHKIDENSVIDLITQLNAESERCLDLSVELDEVNNVIELMAEDYINDMYEQSAQTPCQWFDEIKHKEKCKYLFKCKGNNGIECIKEYYFKVAKGEEYKNKYCGGED